MFYENECHVNYYVAVRILMVSAARGITTLLQTNVTVYIPLIRLAHKQLNLSVKFCCLIFITIQTLLREFVRKL